MGSENSRRDFVLGGALAATGAWATRQARGASREDQPLPTPKQPEEEPQTENPPGRQDEAMGYPRDHAGAGGPVGSPSYLGKLVPGVRSPGEPPLPLETPDLDKLPWTMKEGVKEFHLRCQVVQRELLPGMVMDLWGFNGSTPGPTIEVDQGDTVRIVVHNELPEPTSMHWHGLEIPIAMDGVPYIVQDPIPPGGTYVYEFKLHQIGTFFYHAHFAMQEAMGMVGLFIIHPPKAFDPPVDQDFGIILQEFVFGPTNRIPDTLGMEFNFLTINGRCGPMTTPMVVKLGNRVRIRIVNFSTADHHPMHIHGHTFWVTGTEGGRIPESAWIPGNNVLVGVAQAREIEFIANNVGDWVFHCHMFHHMMNHMVSMAGPMMRQLPKDDPRYRVPGYPQGMAMSLSPEEVAKVTKPETRGMRAHWYNAVKGLFTVVRVLPPELYDKVVTGMGEVPVGASVPGATPGGDIPHRMHMKDGNDIRSPAWEPR